MVVGKYDIVDGIGIQQRPGFEEPFANFINQVDPKRILELGTSYGGLTHFLRSITNVPIISVEKFENKTHPDIVQLADTRIADCYKEPFLSDVAKPYISTPGKTLILVDADPKTWGFHLYAKYLKPGDYIAVHDFFESWDDFYDNYHLKSWNWCESTLVELQGTITEHNLVKLDVGLKDYFWGVFKKPSE